MLIHPFNPQAVQPLLGHLAQLTTAKQVVLPTPSATQVPVWLLHQQAMEEPSLLAPGQGVGEQMRLPAGLKGHSRRL